MKFSLTLSVLISNTYLLNSMNLRIKMFFKVQQVILHRLKKSLIELNLC